MVCYKSVLLAMAKQDANRISLKGGAPVTNIGELINEVAQNLSAKKEITNVYDLKFSGFGPSYK